MERLNDPVGAWYNIEGAGRVADLTIGDLATIQWGNYYNIVRDFETALDAVRGW